MMQDVVRQENSQDGGRKKERESGYGVQTR